MKKIILLSITLLITGFVNKILSQEQLSPVIAVFNGDQVSFDKEVQSTVISFTLKNQDENARADFENKAKRYATYFTVYVPSLRESTTSQAYVLILHNNTRLIMLNRLFISSNINQIEFNGVKMNREEFFQPFMK